MIALNHITKRFNQTIAVHDISFEVAEGETLVLLGTSGCGKTTTLRMINRLIEPTSGSILINGKNSMQQPVEALRRNMGYVLQHHGLFPHYTVAENIAVVPQLLGWNKEKIQHRVAELMHKLQLPEEYANAYPSGLSGGQQQRVGVARALAADPKILLMDEPFGALDPVTRVSIRNEIKGLDELKKKTIVLVTHDVEEAFELGNRICLMDKGSIVQMGSPSELLFQPANHFVTSFFKEQRLQLELQTIRLEEVWLQFSSPKEINTNDLFSSHTLWDAMKEITGKNKNAIAKHETTGEVKEISFDALQQALQSKKQVL
ncbi:MAG: ABC transporter ATP-binding protein [Bacteroidota bacterium]|nr:ABC transporter ATP-binding protein [Bacteroidota bacterium]